MATHEHNTNNLQALTMSAQQQDHNQLQRRSDIRQESHHLTVIAYILFSQACQTGLQMFQQQTIWATVELGLVRSGCLSSKRLASAKPTLYQSSGSAKE